MKRAARFVLHRIGLDVRRAPRLDDRADYVAAFGERAVRERRFYNVAAGGHFGFGGDFSHPCWTSVDVVRPIVEGHPYRPDVHLPCDLLALEPLPIATASAELVFSQFSIEHLTQRAAEHMLRETWRVLKPGAIARIACPNVDLDCLAYERGDRSFFYWSVPDEPLEHVVLHHFAAHACVGFEEGGQERVGPEEFRRLYRTLPREQFLDHCASRCDPEIQKRRRRCHVNWWNPAKLSRALTDAGFSRAYPVGPGQSAAPVLRNAHYFNRLFQQVAMTLEAIK